MAIELREVTKTYGSEDLAVRVLKDISLTIADGEMCAIMGPSGSGKSTLMNILGLLDTPTSGRYLLDGQDCAALDGDATARIRNRTIGFVFQSYNLVRRTRAIDNVQLPLLYAGVPPETRHRRAEAALRAVGLGAQSHRLPTELSGGQQQRVAIARAIAMRPSLILADEPTGALDTTSSKEVMEIFQRLNQRLGITVVFVTHEPEIAAYTRRILHIRDGYVESDERVRRPRVAA